MSAPFGEPDFYDRLLALDLNTSEGLQELARLLAEQEEATKPPPKRTLAKSKWLESNDDAYRIVENSIGFFVHNPFKVGQRGTLQFPDMNQRALDFAEAYADLGFPYYVYAVYAPSEFTKEKYRSWLPFTCVDIGFGTNHRFRHILEGKKYGDVIDELVRQVREAGKPILVELIYASAQESYALAVEAAVIARLGRQNIGTGPLLNRLPGGIYPRRPETPEGEARKAEGNRKGGLTTAVLRRQANEENQEENEGGPTDTDS